MPREGPLALALRGAEGRPRQPEELEPRRRLRAGRGQEPPRLRGPRGPGADRLPAPGRVQPQRELRGRGHVQLRRAGLALHAPGLPHALDVRCHRGLDPRRLADLLRRPRALLREGRVRDRGERRRGAERVQGPAAQAPPHAADDPEVPRVRDPQAGGAAPGPAPLRHPAPHQLRALQRALGLHAHPLVRRASAARRTPRTARRTPSSRGRSPPATRGCGPSAR